jgi:hypothetical protein
MIACVSPDQLINYFFDQYRAPKCFTLAHWFARFKKGYNKKPQLFAEDRKYAKNR